MIREVIYDILRLRNYVVADKEGFVNSKAEEFLTHLENDVNSRIYVFFPKLSSKVGVYTIRQYILTMQKNNVNKAVIIVKDSITAFAKQVFIDAKPLEIECFKENEVLINKLHHALVPKHELISEEEKNEILKIYSLKENQLPKILSTDPIAKYFSPQKGQVFKITRPSETSGNSISYRIVI